MEMQTKINIHLKQFLPHFEQCFRINIIFQRVHFSATLEKTLNILSSRDEEGEYGIRDTDAASSHPLKPF